MVRKTKAEAEQTRQEIIAAARAVFYECGVSRTSLEKVAQAAGVTRGAVYWHFANKAALFFAMREEPLKMLENASAHLASPELADPLDAIERFLLTFFELLESSSPLRRTFEIMALRCEYVDEFAPVLVEVNKPVFGFLAKLRTAYASAAEKALMRPGLDPEAMAYDTLSFATGLFNNWLADVAGDELRGRTPAMIRSHLALRRRESPAAAASFPQ